MSHIPGVVRSAVDDKWSKYIFGNSVNLPIASVYLASALVLFCLSLLVKPNANSVHRLYRDRLSNAFLFDPTRYADNRMASSELMPDQGRDFAALKLLMSLNCVISCPGKDALSH